MNTFALIPFFAGFINLSLALFVFSRDPRLHINQVFLLWGVALSTWNLGAFFLFRVTDPDSALVFARITQFGVILLPVTFLHLTLLVIKIKSRFWVPALYAVTIGFLFTIFSPLFVAGVTRLEYAWFAVGGPLFFVFAFVFYPGCLVPAFVLLARSHFRAEPEQRRKLRVLLVSSTLLAGLGSHDLLPMLGITRYPFVSLPVYPWGTVAASLYGVLVGYSVLSDQLLDMRVALGRQAAMLLRFGFLLATSYMLLALAAVFQLIDFRLGDFVTTLAVVTAAVLITARFFPRLVGAQAEQLERRILGDRFEGQQQLRGFLPTVARFTDGTVLAREATQVPQTALRLNFVHLVTFDPVTMGLAMSVKAPESHRPVEPPPALLAFFGDAATNTLDCRNAQAAVWASELEHEARRALETQNVEFVFALRNREKSLSGLLCVGGKMNRAVFTSADVEILVDLAEELSRAFERLYLSERAKLVERLETLSTLTRGLSHDINNQLQPIQTYLQVQKEPRSATEADLLRLAKRNTQTIRNYVQESAFFAHSFTPHFRTLHVSALLDSVVSVTEERAKLRKVTVTRSCGEETFSGDPVLLERCLANVVSNACDASPAGATVELRAQYLPPVAGLSRWVRIEVIDRGHGIASAHLGKVWQAYFTTKNTGNEMRGFGLGLTIAQTIVLMHHGKITLDSVEGQGTTVRVDLPKETPT